MLSAETILTAISEHDSTQEVLFRHGPHVFYLGQLESILASGEQSRMFSLDSNDHLPEFVLAFFLEQQGKPLTFGRLKRTLDRIGDQHLYFINTDGEYLTVESIEGNVITLA